MVKMMTLKQQELKKGHLRGQQIVSMYRWTPCQGEKAQLQPPCLNVVRKYGNRIFLQGRRNDYIEKEPWNWQREGQLPPCKPDEGNGNESLGPVLGETPKSLVMMLILVVLKDDADDSSVMRTTLMMTKTATCSNPPSPD